MFLYDGYVFRCIAHEDYDEKRKCVTQEKNLLYTVLRWCFIISFLFYLLSILWKRVTRREGAARPSYREEDSVIQLIDHRNFVFLLLGGARALQLQLRGLLGLEPFSVLPRSGAEGIALHVRGGLAAFLLARGLRRELRHLADGPEELPSPLGEAQRPRLQERRRLALRRGLASRRHREAVARRVAWTLPPALGRREERGARDRLRFVRLLEHLEEDVEVVVFLAAFLRVLRHLFGLRGFAPLVEEAEARGGGGGGGRRDVAFRGRRGGLSTNASTHS